MREAEIEKRVCDYAKRRNWLVYKFQTPAQRGVPDRIFLKDQRVLFIEFKAPGKRPTNQQAQIHDKIRQAGFQVFIVDDIAQGEALFNE